ncbi:hypothetical protein [Martelella mediterranea]|uniref:Lipoprotein n=1 Tax=Martelella mediterranea DSM 17316 TaxID=1122214 RepID=A0A1U9Z667_9HYPH|nr:hypothetical protein [Martelella mediterranea]AQZ53229.1 hypothetical protein Mame_03928 [Martelella mediterranea DSM 17316]
MKRYHFALMLSFLAFAGCGRQVEDGLLRILAEALPEGAEPEVLSTCYSFLGLGPTVALFRYPVKGVTDAPATSLNPDGSKGWTWQPSLGDFVEKQSKEPVLGLAMTVLDGKQCLRDMTDDANSILFEEHPGLYYSTNREEVIIILFDGPEREGVIFIQAP